MHDRSYPCTSWETYEALSKVEYSGTISVSCKKTLYGHGTVWRIV